MKGTDTEVKVDAKFKALIARIIKENKVLLDELAKH